LTLVAKSQMPLSYPTDQIVQVLSRHFGKAKLPAAPNRAEQALRESEERFRNLIEGSIQGIHVHQNGKILFANQAVADIFGYDSPEDILALDSVLALLAPGERQRLWQVAQARLRGEDVPNRQSYQGMRRDGSTIWVESMVSLVNWRGETAIQSTIVDITERRQAEEALKQSHKLLEQRVAQRTADLKRLNRQLRNEIGERQNAERLLLLAKEQAEHANSRKSDFLANVSHELRTPLNAIIGFSDIIKTDLLGPLDKAKYQEYAADINESAGILLGLINELLDLSKIEAGKLEINKESLDLAKLLPEVVHMFRPQTRKKRLSLKLEIASGLPPLLADGRAVRQMVINLLSNACKFTPAGGRILLRADCGKDAINLAVSDSGEGIESQYLESVLEPFVQGDSRAVRTQAGTGLGLSIVKSLIEQHDGHLDLTSTVGQGTTVTLTFPLGSPPRARGGQSSPQA